MAIRYALAALRNVGGAAMAALVAEREARGPFADLMDFAERLDPHQVNKRQLEHLAAAGAFEGLGVNRRQAFDSVDLVMRHSLATQAERESAQESLFGGAGAAAEIRPSVPTLAEWPAEERLRHEFEALGFYLSAHPLESYRKLCDRLNVVEWRDVSAGTVRGASVKMAGIVTSRRLTTSSRGARMAFVQMSDASGAFEVTLFSETLAAARDLLDAGQPLLLSVDIQRRDEDLRLTASRLELLDAAATQAAAGLRIFVHDEAPLETLAAVFREHGARGKGRVSLVLDAEAREVELELGQGYAISPAMRGAIKSIPGIVDVQDL